MNSSNYGLAAFGGGVGLRHAHFEEIISKKPLCNWFEIISEDFMDYGGYVRECLLEIRRNYPIIGHGVCMSVGSTDALDMEYLKNLKIFLNEINSPWASDHLCFTMVDHTNLNDLIPLPFTREAVENCAARLRVIQDVLERPFLVENVTRYVTLSERELCETDFINEVTERANCGLLLDITNVYLNSQFHNFDAYEFISKLPLQRVGQMHLAGWEQVAGGKIIDSHDAPVPEQVWKLFKFAIERVGKTSVLVEWDKELPPIERLVAEAHAADDAMAEVLNRRAA